MQTIFFNQRVVFFETLSCLVFPCSFVHIQCFHARLRHSCPPPAIPSQLAISATSVFLTHVSVARQTPYTSRTICISRAGGLRGPNAVHKPEPLTPQSSRTWPPRSERHVQASAVDDIAFSLFCLYFVSIVVYIQSTLLPFVLSADCNSFGVDLSETMPDFDSVLPPPTSPAEPLASVRKSLRAKREQHLEDIVAAEHKEPAPSRSRASSINAPALVCTFVGFVYSLLNRSPRQT